MKNLKRSGRVGPFQIDKIEIAEQEQTNKLSACVEDVLREIGWEGSLVTDLSRMSDFPLNSKTYNRISKKFGFEVSDNDLIIDVARKLNESKHIQK